MKHKLVRRLTILAIFAALAVAARGEPDGTFAGARPGGRIAIPRPAWIPAWPVPGGEEAFMSPPGGAAALTSFPPRIPPNCPQFPLLNAPGVLCEAFDTDRNGVAGFQFTRLPVTVDPNDPLRANGDPSDDVLGFTIDGGLIPAGTDAATCPDDVGAFAGCQDAVSEENDWHLHSPYEGPGAGYDPLNRPGIGAPDQGKAHSGFRSMHLGRHTDPSTTVGDATRFRQVSAFVLDSQGDPSIPGVVLGPESTLEFWHMISVPDYENFGGFFGIRRSYGGSQLQVSLLGANGSFERWHRLNATVNPYDNLIQEIDSFCGFDPGDDQLVPGDLTMCDSSPVWSEIGDIFGTDATCQTDSDGNDPLHKDCGVIQGCIPGPNCTENGSIGVGVWARSGFDLSQFAGRVARLRWIAMMQGGWSFGVSRSAVEPEPGQPYYIMNDGDDGWWIDDIVLTDLRLAPCGMDGDEDGYEGCVSDCNDSDASIWSTPGEVPLLDFSDSETLQWLAPAETGASLVWYDVFRSEEAADFIAITECTAINQPAQQLQDPVSPPAGVVFFYLARAQNACPSGLDSGPLGAGSDGTPRTGRSCP